MTMRLLADIGGTHVRFAFEDETGSIQTPLKFSVTDFDTPAQALTHYCEQAGIESGGPVLIATAARPDEKGKWQFYNQNRWVIDGKSLQEAGWSLELIVNDFAASARGAVSLPDDLKEVLKTGTPDPEGACAIIGPGTGLGLAYAMPQGNTWHIRESAGAHMLAAAATDEQYLFLGLVNSMKGDGTIIVPEDVASGRGLPMLYKAVCVYGGYEPKERSVEELLENAEDQNVKQTLRLFHEFLGLFAHNVIVTGHACGGLYLDGGMVQRLREQDLFDFDTFEKFMVLKPVPSVKRMLKAVPVYVVTDPYVSLRGLMEMTVKLRV
jgi:glucokinase